MKKLQKIDQNWPLCCITDTEKTHNFSVINIIWNGCRRGCIFLMPKQHNAFITDTLSYYSYYFKFQKPIKLMCV